MSSSVSAPESPRNVHEAQHEHWAAQAARWEALAFRIGLFQLLSFVLGATLGTTAWVQNDRTLGVLSTGSFLLFLGLRLWQSRCLVRAEAARTREEIHRRQLRRLDNHWQEFADNGSAYADATHPYASDIDLVGPASLFQRINVTHSLPGAQALYRWLSEAASTELVAQRQEAVAELAANVELRQELEAALWTKTSKQLDPSALCSFAARTPPFATNKALTWVSKTLPLLTIALWILAALTELSSLPLLVTLGAQFAVIVITDKEVRLRYAELLAGEAQLRPFAKALSLIRDAEVHSPLLRDMQAQLNRGGRDAIREIDSLMRITGWFELRAQPLAHLFLNPLLLWDLACLRMLARWQNRVGADLEPWFTIIASWEALASLATLYHQDPQASFPNFSSEASGLEAEALAHPLLPVSERVANDLKVDGSGHALLITGSNMAGKSTLLRSVGLNLALTQAGGPVCAKGLSVGPCRLRASMRIQDSLQHGSSYFHAELQRVGQVIESMDSSPTPIFFLLDELLRGTNAKARHRGARAILLHLLNGRAMGLLATHDTALCTLEEGFGPDEEGRDTPTTKVPTPKNWRVSNLHFTDTMLGEEMHFDYRLRQGPVTRSNALQLLAELGIPIPKESMVAESEIRYRLE